jgi:hypothetical protein
MVIAAAAVLAVYYLAPWRIFFADGSPPPAPLVAMGLADMGARPLHAVKQKRTADTARQQRLRQFDPGALFHGPDSALAGWYKFGHWSVSYSYRYDPFFGFDF